MSGGKKGDKRNRTRASLIKAAGEVINEKGYERLTLEEVARRAGMTRGAFYNNFKDKEELLLGVAETLWQPIGPKLEPGAGYRDLLEALGEAVADAAEKRRPLAVGSLSFQLYALTHEPMRLRLFAENKAIYNWAENQMLETISTEDLPMPAAEFVRTMHALTEGLMTLHFLTPELITRKTIVNAFKAFK